MKRMAGYTNNSHVDRPQVRLIAQGASPEAYAYWEPMLNQMMRTFQYADWWEEITGFAWLPSMQMELDEDDSAAAPAKSAPSEPAGGGGL